MEKGNESKKISPSEMKANEVHGTGEWAKHNVNFIVGCLHDCLYCCSKTPAMRFRDSKRPPKIRKTPTTWKRKEINEDKYARNFRKRKGRFFFPSSHDISPKNLDNSIQFLKKILLPGNDVLIVSKPHLKCIKALCKEFVEYKDSILFRFTIGSINNEVLKFWEPGAPPFAERVASLKYAFEHGFNTSVSCEPMLDNNIEAVVEATIPYVTDSIWIGKANRLRQNMSVNGHKDIKSKKSRHCINCPF